MVDQDNNGSIHYDEFISTMDINMQSREKSVLTHVEDQIFKIIKSYLTYQPESLYEIMQSFDINNTGVIDASVLPQIFKRIGVYKPDAHMKMLMQAGGYQVTDKKIDYIEF
jgi:Ca2+-binding EF-hand superfamily protein